MALVSVIGAGVAGPAAALALAHHGHTVTVWEQRPESELKSDGILGITRANFKDLAELGADLSMVELPNQFTNVNKGTTSWSSYHYITWTDLHNVLSQTAKDAGVTFRYGHKMEEVVDADIVVRATGVAGASEVSTPTYTGYVVVRGLSTKFAGTNWATVYGDDEVSGQWRFAVGDTRDGASITMFVKRKNVWKRTTYTAVAPIETEQLAPEFRELV